MPKGGRCELRLLSHIILLGIEVHFIHKLILCQGLIYECFDAASGVTLVRYYRTPPWEQNAS